MEHRHDSYQIGQADIEGDAVRGAGRPLTELAREYDSEVDSSSLADVPVDGWRPLRLHAGDLLIGAPTTDDDQNWWVARIRQGALRIHPDPLRLRPGRSERRRGLALRWPTVVSDQDAGVVASGREFVIDVVNVGDTRWHPDGDGFRAIGTFTATGSTDFSFSWARVGEDQAVPLDPGDYARVPVKIDRGVWNTLEPGAYDLQAVLVDLSLRVTNPLAVELSADEIARHRTPPRERQMTPEMRRKHTDFDIQRLTNQLAATKILGPLVTALSATTSRREALAIISDLLGCDARIAEVIWMSSLGDLLPLAAPDLQARLAELQTAAVRESEVEDSASDHNGVSHPAQYPHWDSNPD